VPGLTPVDGLAAGEFTSVELTKAHIEAIEAAGLRDQVKILIGGAPVTQEFADKIGADGFARDASSAVRLTKQLIGIA
jgi:5-methyltetrahydrofolate--homocysteine methyltransferase